MTELNTRRERSRRVIHIRHWIRYLVLGWLSLLSGWLWVLPAYSGSEIYFVINDHLGTPQMLMDMDQKVVWQVTSQTPFGEVEVDEDPDGDGEKVEFNLRAPGQYYDKETGLNYNHHRYYDPKTGRYITADLRGITLDFSDPQRQVAAQMGIPIYPSRTGSINHLYHYANQNPVRYTDPTGEAVPLAVAACAGNPACAALVAGGVAAVGTGLYNIGQVLATNANNGGSGSSTTGSGTGGGTGDPCANNPDPLCSVQQQIQNTYPSTNQCPNYPQGFRAVQNGTKNVKVNNTQLLNQLHQQHPGKWTKVYQNGFNASGQKVSLHFFRHSSGRVFNLKVINRWSHF